MWSGWTRPLEVHLRQDGATAARDGEVLATVQWPPPQPHAQVVEPQRTAMAS